MRAYKRLYWARTSDDKLFLEKPDDKVRYRRDFDGLGQNIFHDQLGEVEPEKKDEDSCGYEGGRRAS